MASTLLFNALKEAIDEEMANDVNVCIMGEDVGQYGGCLLYTSPSPRDRTRSRMPSSA